MLKNIQNCIDAFNMVNEEQGKIKLVMEQLCGIVDKQAEALGLLNFIILKYLPQEHIQEATKEFNQLYNAERERQTHVN